MVRILLRDSIILRGKELEPIKGYIYVEDDKIAYVGLGKVREEHEVAELYVTARERIILPGTITPVTWVSLYPFRLLLLSGNLQYYEVFQVIGKDEVYYASLLAGYELLKHGVTTVGIMDQVYQEEVIRALFDIGLRILVLVDPYMNDVVNAYNRWDGKEGRIKVYVLVETSTDARRYADIVGRDRIVAKPGKIVSGANIFIDPVTPLELHKTIISSMFLDKWVKGCGLTIGLALKYSMFDIAHKLVLKGKANGKEALVHIITRNAEVMGLENTGVIDEGYKADLVVLNASEPPGWPPIPLESNIFYEHIMGLDLRTETVIIDGEIALDVGEPLNVGYEKIYKAKEKVSSLVEEYAKRVKEGT